MACACKATSDVLYLQRKYGVNRKKEKISIRDNFGNILGDLMVKLVSIILLPIIFIHVIIMTVFNKKRLINVTDFIGIRQLKLHNVRK